MITVENLSCGYNGINVIKGINLEVKKGQNLSIIGPNGCGKTTLLKAIANLIDYDGEIKINKKEIKSIKRKELAKNIAFMSQSSAIYFPYTVYETVALGRYAYMNNSFSNLSKNDEEKVLSAIENVGLLDIKDKLISELSGGQLQRVYLARTFAQDPDIILLDEPTNHLDLKCQIEILEYINKWTKENHKTIIAVLHDLNLVQMFSEEVIMINDGKIILKGKSKEVLSDKMVKEVYKIDIADFMKRALKKWE